MDAVQTGSNLSPRRVALGVASLMTVTLLAGGAGGYLFRGTATIAVHQTTSAISRAPAHAATLPRAGNPAQRAGVWIDGAAASSGAAANSHRTGHWIDGPAAALPNAANPLQRTGVWSDGAALPSAVNPLQRTGVWSDIAR
jgi:hypothetical protein